MLSHPLFFQYFNGELPLVMTARYGYKDLSSLLISHGALVDEEDSRGDTAVSAAFASNQVSLARYFLEQGHLRPNGLIQLVRLSNPEYLLMVLENLRQSQVEYGFVNQSSLFHGKLPIVEAVKCGALDLIPILKRWGANVELPDDNGDSAISTAIEQGSFEMATLLLHGSAEIQPNFLMMAIKTIRHNSSLTKLLYEHVKQNQDANFLNDEKLFGGELPLVVAAERNLSEITWFLLERGALPDLQDVNGRSAMATAVTNGYAGIVETLLIHGADPNGEDGRFLRIACRRWSNDVPRILIAFGANLNLAQDDFVWRQDSLIEEARNYRNATWSTFLGCLGDDSKESVFACLKESTLYEPQVLSIIKSMIKIGKDWQFPKGNTLGNDWRFPEINTPVRRLAEDRFPSWFSNTDLIDFGGFFDEDFMSRILDSIFHRVSECRTWSWAFDPATYRSFKMRVLLVFKEFRQIVLPMESRKTIKGELKFSDRMNWRLRFSFGFGSGLLF
eukprot:TRINITY_DN21768_c0_g1_i3.p1 TRINITY_DN21768_c0_g1~~TRINITY_DN21768_c0_g1_i3.p1  ORF type:complete len:503 (+),score=99.98 TRINITY_DN21768_c0_g1_i3:251-1759(+)